MADELGTSIAIENVPGAASLRGTGRLYNADPDGYTIGGFNPPSTPVSAMVNQPEYDMTDLEGVGTYARTPFVIVANPTYEIEDFDDLLSRYADGELEIFSGKERGGVDHVLALLMQENDNYDFQWDRYVGYDGTGPAVQATISDEVPAAIATDTGAAGAVEDDRLDVIACLSSQGSQVFPDIPSTTDLGYDNIDFLGQLVRGIYAPEGTSEDQI
jgi:tripartite-type tricarboxylate transporter receptor subunit TctC